MEFVFVVPRTALFPERTPHGVELFSTGEGASAGEGAGWRREAFDACVHEEGFFVERDYAERTPALKQVIPYTVVVRRQRSLDAQPRVGDQSPIGDTEVLLLRRTKKGGETRLHDKLSIGVGGHVNPVDALESHSADNGVTARRRDPLAAATRREVMEEELQVTGTTCLVPVGILNDDTTCVGAVHVGFVQVLELIDGDATIRELDQLEGEFVTVDDLRRQVAAGANFETWSSLLVPLLDTVLALLPDPASGAAAEGNGHLRIPAGATARR